MEIILYLPIDIDSTTTAYGLYGSLLGGSKTVGSQGGLDSIYKELARQVKKQIIAHDPANGPELTASIEFALKDLRSEVDSNGNIEVKNTPTNQKDETVN